MFPGVSGPLNLNLTSDAKMLNMPPTTKEMQVSDLETCKTSIRNLFALLKNANPENGKLKLQWRRRGRGSAGGPGQ